jgi:thioredoxin-dependent peroxiredoxin
MLGEGEQAPDFTLPDQDGNEVALSDLRGETVVLYFYPRADTQRYICGNGGAGSHRHHPGIGAQEAG